MFVTQVLKHVFCRRELLLMVVDRNKLVDFALVVSGLWKKKTEAFKVRTATENVGSPM